MSASVTTILKNFNNNKHSYLMMDEENLLLEVPVRAKKRRLDHLSWEEKVQRKKLKNRVAAQTSRDRKKAKMEQMEQSVDDLIAQNEKVVEDYENLKSLNAKLLADNDELLKKLSEPCRNCSQSRSVECDDRIGSTVSLNLLKQGSVRHSAAALSQQTSKATLKIVLMYLLCQIYSTKSQQKSISAPLRSSHKVYSKISPQILKQLLIKRIPKNQVDASNILLRKWWGRHQNNWNPIGASA